MTAPKSIAAAPEFWGRIDRPNIFIKIPGTAEGVPAIEESIFAGINVNVTLLFSLAAYDAIHEAFIRGLERRVEAGLPIDDVHSVASFFVSRVDTAVDKPAARGLAAAWPGGGRQRQAGLPALLRPPSPATAGRRWRPKGARVQRPLWASTGTKNPAYSDVLYVDSLIGPDMRQHDARGHHRGLLRPRHRGPHGGCRCRRPRKAELDAIAAAGCRLDAVTSQLELDGVKSFSASFDSLLGTIQERLDQIGRGALREHRRANAREPAAGRPAGRRRDRAGGVRDLRRHRRPGSAQAAAGDLQPRPPRTAAGPFRAGRLRPHRDDRRPVPQLLPGGDRESTRARRSTSTTGRRSPPCCATTPAASTTTRTSTRWARCWNGSTPSTVPRATGCTTCRPRPVLPGDRAAHGRGQAQPAAGVRPGGDREAVRPRPGQRARAGRDRAQAVPRAADLPDRPLPGQGDRPEHLRVPVRERDLRAGVEQHATSTTCRSRWPSRSVSSTGRRSTRRPASSATSSRTTCCRCWRWWRWSRPSPFEADRCATRR